MDTPTRHNLNEKRLSLCHPDLTAKVRRVITALEQMGFQPLVDGGVWRSPAEQLEKYRLGYSKLRFGLHCAIRWENGQMIPCSLAVDLVDVRFQWDVPQTHPYWKALGAAYKEAGIYWGGDWHTFPDVAHGQLCDSSKVDDVKLYYDTKGHYGWFPPVTVNTRRHILIHVGGKVLNGELDVEAGVAYYTGGGQPRVALRDKWKGASFSWNADKTEVEVTLPGK